jgi:hypothetical protein
LYDDTQEGKAAPETIFEDEKWSWLKGTVLEGESLVAIKAFQGWFEEKVIQAQAAACGYLVRRRNTEYADYQSYVEGTELERDSPSI